MEIMTRRQKEREETYDIKLAKKDISDTLYVTYRNEHLIYVEALNKNLVRYTYCLVCAVFGLQYFSMVRQTNHQRMFLIYVRTLI